MANRYYQDNNPNKGESGNGKTGSMKSKASGDPKGDPKFTAAPDNAKKDGFGYGNKAPKGGRGSANRD